MLSLLLLSLSTLILGAEFGLIAGGGMSQAYGSKDQAVGYDIDIKFYPVLRVGVFAEYPITQELALVQEILYSQKGSKQRIRVEDQPVNFDLRYDTDYIEVPFLLKYNLFNIAQVPVKSLVGFSFSYLLQAEYNLDGVVNVGESTVALKDSYQMKDLDEFDYSLLYGFSANLKKIGIPVDLDYRFSLSWYKINYPTFAGLDPVRLSNHSHILTLSYKFWK